MRLPRRSFVKSGVVTAVSAGIAFSHPGLLLGQEGKSSPSISLLAQSDPVFSFTQSTFEGFVGDIFTAPNALGQRVALRLQKVTAFTVNAKTNLMLLKSEQPQPRTFTLSFTSREKLPEFTSIHKMNHPRLGNFDLFLTSTQMKDGSYIYEAVISHL